MSKCNLECEVWSRVTGYFRPVKNWNRGKREEFKDRKSYNLDEALKKTKEAEK
jgi:ribonucleoside-triphosphate reductase